ncbi:site-specific tyrosine recombinase XerC [Candidatus Saccharibacteria bacterium]|nr:site-specific tyrosine recombinase XerC [Candidatus Saccharibacteria bacterium]
MAMLEGYVLAYKQQLQAQHYAPQSIEYKQLALEDFIAWCEERGIERIEQITRPTLQRYQRHLTRILNTRQKPLTIASQRNRLTAIKTWFRFLMRENHIVYNPASELELPRQAKRLPKHTLTAQEAERVLMQPDIQTDLGLRDRAILEVLYSTGIRRQELINLKTHDVNFEAGVIAVRQGKGRKDRFVPIGDRALNWIETYQQDIRVHHALPSSPANLFLDEAGRALERNRLSRRVKKYVKSAKITKEGSCHLFRHTMATLMLENGADIRYIQHMLGHAALSTTELYTHVAIHKLKEIHTATHPAKPKQALIETLIAEAEEET